MAVTATNPNSVSIVMFDYPWVANCVF